MHININDHVGVDVRTMEEAKRIATEAYVIVAEKIGYEKVDAFMKRTDLTQEEAIAFVGAALSDKVDLAISIIEGKEIKR